VNEKIISADQMQGAAFWERKFLRKECSLNEALSMTFHIGAPVGPYLVEAYERALKAYYAGEIADLAVGLGCELTKREKNALKKPKDLSRLRRCVEKWKELGFKMQDPTYYSENNAFHKAAEELPLAASTIYELYYKRKS
jgi:hypothetical protein